MKQQIRTNIIACQAGVHRHTFGQVLIGWQGRLSLAFEGTGGYLEPGVLSVIPDGAAHEFEGLSKDCELIVLDLPTASQLDHSKKNRESKGNPGNPNTTILHKDAAPIFLPISKKIHTLLDYYYDYRDHGCSIADEQFNERMSALLAFEIISGHHHLTQHAPSPAVQRIINRDKLDELILQNISTILTNADLAQYFCFSESHFYVQFKRQFRMTPQRYVLIKRLVFAQHLIQKNHGTITAIAQRVGFSEASSFTRAFKRQFGVTPGRLGGRTCQGSRPRLKQK